jgi:hypothetical protein
MALSNQSKKAVQGAFGKQFPESKQKLTSEKDDGGVEMISIHVKKLERADVLALASLLSDVRNTFFIQRAGTGLTIGFY